MAMECEGLEAVSVRELVVQYGSVVAVEGLSFEVGRGEIYGLLGPNGAGKSSTIKTLVGLVEPTSGDVRVFGHSHRDEMVVKSLIGFVPEDVLLFDSLTPREFLEFISSVRRLAAFEANARIERMVRAFRMEPYFDSPIATLSLGTKQKVAVIAALLHDPPLLVLDEPLNGLDARTSRILKELVSLHARKGGAVIFCTHVMEVAERLCTRVGIINHGRMVGEGTIQELRELVHADESLEDIFLKVTAEEAGIAETIRALEGDWEGGGNGAKD
ncbi:MAG: ABC transporter ATP-binding protein [Firmicutes bacterium]|jgi:ABC-2 type transport system ATP-binding protein|nr:ABC transporter ATP-binding protein [Bacillota bacterium]MDH7495201.1 ABC transporter ATP-binding protein [Bacillota bacterium]